MPKKMLIDATHPEETRVVVVAGNRIDEFDFESAARKPLKGNIFLAKVTRVEPSLQACFVEYGGNRHGFLAFSEIHPDYYQIPVADRKALLEEERALARDQDEDGGRRNRRRRDEPREAANGEAASGEAASGEAANGETANGEVGEAVEGAAGLVEVAPQAAVVEAGDVRAVLKSPRHPYTQALIAALPRAEVKRGALAGLPGVVPDLLTPPPGCRFLPRCPIGAADCARAAPGLAPVDTGQRVACFRAEHAA